MQTLMVGSGCEHTSWIRKKTRSGACAVLHAFYLCRGGHHTRTQCRHIPFLFFFSALLLYGLSTLETCAPSYAFTNVRAQAVPLMGLLHGVFVHLPSLWATSVHSRRAIELMELLVYVHLLHVLLLFLVEMYAPWYPVSGVWTMAIYFQTQAAWSVCRASQVPRCTLSSNLLQLSMVASATASAYALLRATCFTSAMGFELYQQHFIGLLASHLCALPLRLLPATTKQSAA